METGKFPILIVKLNVMNKRSKRILAVLLLVLGCTGLFAQDPSNICIIVGELHGTKTFEKVVLTLYKDKLKVSQGRTGKDGEYCFKDLKPGTYRVISTLKGYSTAEMEDIVIKPGVSITGKIEIRPCSAGEH
jgi:hypothetical protein